LVSIYTHIPHFGAILSIAIGVHLFVVSFVSFQCYIMLVLELARDHLNETGKYRVIAGIISPVSDGYAKKVKQLLNILN